MSLKDLLTDGAQELGVALSDKQMDQFMQYLDNLNGWNEKINLTAIKDDQEIVINHFLDSLSIASFVEDKKKLLDIGSGGGFPGLPLKIVHPSLSVIMIDSVNKKVSFLKDTIRKLGLENIDAVWCRAEDKENRIPRQHFDFVVNRAVGTIYDTVQLSLPYLSENGVVILMRGKKGAEEWDQESQEFKDSYNLVEYREFTLPYSESKRTVIVLDPK